MEGILKVTPQQLIDTADDFGNRATTVGNLTQSMLTLVGGLTSVWSGDAASEYMRKFSDLRDDIEQMIRMIQEHVSDLREMAQNYINAENANMTEIESLSSDVIV